MYIAGAEAVKDRGPVVGPSAQRKKDVRTSPDMFVVVKVTEHVAPAVHASVTGAVYVPGTHPAPDTVNGMDAVLLNVVRTAKLAVIDCAADMVTGTGFVAVIAEPDHPVN